MTNMIWPDEAVEAAAQAVRECLYDSRSVAIAALTAAAEAMIKSGKAWHISPTDTAELNMIRNTGSTLIIALPE
jgi:hypothetical protein